MGRSPYLCMCAYPYRAMPCFGPRHLRLAGHCPWRAHLCMCMRDMERKRRDVDEDSTRIEGKGRGGEEGGGEAGGWPTGECLVCVSRRGATTRAEGTHGSCCSDRSFCVTCRASGQLPVKSEWKRQWCTRRELQFLAACRRGKKDRLRQPGPKGF